MPPRDMVHLHNDITWQGSDNGAFLTIKGKKTNVVRLVNGKKMNLVRTLLIMVDRTLSMTFLAIFDSPRPFDAKEGRERRKRRNGR